MPKLAAFSTDLLHDLATRQLLPPLQPAALAQAEAQAPFSVHTELRTMLYAGVLTLAGGLGALLYENHQRLGPAVVLTFMTLVLVAAAWYAARHRPAFTWGVAPRTSVAADYALLLACLLLLGLEGYAQAQYSVFGTRYGLATALPALVFLPLAYRYDHRGVLALGITALAAWVGVSAAPLGFLNGDFTAAGLNGPAFWLGAALIAAAFHAEWTAHKAHFAPTYLSLGANVAAAALLATLIQQWGYTGAVVAASGALAGVCLALYLFAQRTQSLWFLVLAAAWAYVLLTYLFFRFGAVLGFDESALVLIPLYFIASAIGFVRFFGRLKTFFAPRP